MKKLLISLVVLSVVSCATHKPKSSTTYVTEKKTKKGRVKWRKTTTVTRY
jgi:hypothetical protein